MILLDLFTFLGRLHPLIVHLPLGFLLIAFISHLASYSKKFSHLDQGVSFILLAGFISAVLACIFGYMLSTTGDYDRQLLRHHKWAGISLAAFSAVLYIFSLKKIIQIPGKIFSLCFAGMFILITYTGHQGGSLTHGSDYLTLKTLTWQKREKPVSISEAYIFEDVVQPILQIRCGQCHGGEKRKGKLSIETLQSLLKGGKTGAAVIAGKSAESELYKRITLNPSDEKFMPTDGKTPLKKNEIEIIKWWIENAGATEGKKLSEIKGNESISAKISGYLGITSEEENNETMVQNINPAIPILADTLALNDLRQKGWMVRLMLHKPVMLDITKPSTANANIDEVKNDLQKLSKNIIWLNLSGNNLADKDLSFLGSLVNLEKLRLENNPVTDLVCEQLKTLTHLQSVNLNETKISASGIATLKKINSVKRIYVQDSMLKIN